MTTSGKRENRNSLYLIRHATTLKPRVTAVPALPLASRHFSTFALLMRQSERNKEIKGLGKEERRKGRNSDDTGGEEAEGRAVDAEEHLFYNNTLS